MIDEITNEFFNEIKSIILKIYPNIEEKLEYEYKEFNSEKYLVFKWNIYYNGIIIGSGIRYKNAYVNICSKLCEKLFKKRLLNNNINPNNKLVDFKEIDEILDKIKNNKGYDKLSNVDKFTLLIKEENK